MKIEMKIKVSYKKGTKSQEGNEFERKTIL